MSVTATRAVGSALGRIEGPAKVTGAAKYAGEQDDIQDVAYVWPVQSTIAKGRIRHIDDAPIRDRPQVLAVLTPDNAPHLQPLADAELAVLQTRNVAYRGQIVAAVVAQTLETAREAAEQLQIEYDEEAHDVELTQDHQSLYKPEHVNPSFPTDTEQGEVDHALATAAFSVDHTYETPALHNNPMEPHATLAIWHGDELTLYDSNQGAYSVQQTLAQLFDLDPAAVHVMSQHVGGGFGSKGTARVNAVLAAMSARLVRRPVKLALHRHHQFAVVGYRTPTIQRIKLGADADGRLTAISHDVVEQTSTLMEFAEQTAIATRIMYAAPNRRTTHRLARLDMPTPRWMRAPGECPGMYALESAMDELAIECDLDPLELRIRNEPARDPESGKPWSSRSLVECLRDGADRFGWAGRDPRPAVRYDGSWLVGTGVAASTYPAYAGPATAAARAERDGTFVVRITASDIGTGARTALTQIAADALRVGTDVVRVDIGDSAFGQANIAGGSMGTASWGWAVTKACTELREEVGRHGEIPVDGIEVHADTSAEIEARTGYKFQGFGAQFAEARVNVDTGEVRVPRLLGVFGVGRVINSRTARSQLIGGMTMGLSMALHEEGVLDPAFGDYVNHDLAEYHVASCADVTDIAAHWVDEQDDHVNPMGSKGIGEIGIVGTAAAVANAVHHATGVRVRDLPIRLDKLLGRLPTRTG
ncbi:MAG: xanthine dehydrogenase family protein molybdopterin-binding subunit [Geodermatophilaceae bacterium]|nr:xanthine dehydrogenase family protein molybdopterin-binding subunit [Geodermatophilaceae bacterium]